MNDRTLTSDEIQSAQKKLEGPDRIESVGTVVHVGLASAAGIAISVPVAQALGVSTILGSPVLASALGGVLAVTTPVGWMVGSAVAVGALAYVLGKVIGDGAKNTTRRKEMSARMGEIEASAAMSAPAASQSKQLQSRLADAVNAKLVTQVESNAMAHWVEKGSMPMDVAMERVESLLRASFVEGRRDDKPSPQETAANQPGMTLDESPELMVHLLLERLHALRGAVAYLNDTPIVQKLKLVTRQLTLTDVLSNQAVIAVAGSQGAGKTTLVKMLYNLDDTWLSGNEGRGERSPLLIVESEAAQSPSGRILVQVMESKSGQDRYVQREIDASPKDFVRALQGDYPGQLLPKLVVPTKYFDGFAGGFLLLPGHEKRTRFNDPWQSLMRQSLLGADMCVIVTDETRLANCEQDQVIQDYRRDLDGSVPIVVISKTEGQSQGKLRDLRSSAALTFGIAADLAQTRVICSGVNPETADGWKSQLASAVQDLPRVQQSFRARQLQAMQDTLNDDLSQILADIDMLAREKSLCCAVFGGPTPKILEAFDAGRAEVRRDYVRAIKSALDCYGDASMKRALKALSEREEGGFNTVKNSWRWLSTTSGERETLLPKYAVDAWQQPWIYEPSHTQHFGHAHQEILGTISMDRLGAPKSVRSYRPPGRSPQQDLGYFGTGHQSCLWKRPSRRQVQDLGLLFAPETTGNLQSSKEMLDAVRLLPAIALEYARIVSAFPNLVGVDPGHFMFGTTAATGDDSPANIDIDAVLGQQGMLILAVIGSALGVAGATHYIDLLNDDTDLLSFAADSASLVSGMKTVGLSVGLLSSVAALLGAGFLVMNFAKSVQRAEGQARDVVRRLTATIADAHYVHFVAEFDHVMDRLRDGVAASLRKRYGQDQEVICLDRLKKAHADVQVLSNELKVSLARNTVFAVG